jgi:arylsulfatase A-like enzyme
MKKKILIKTASILSLCFFLNIKTFSSNLEKPNILLIMVDDHGYGDLSFTGGTDIQTPELDKLFESGVNFTSFYSNCTVCSPTRASLMTGRYPDMVGVPGVIRTQPSSNWGYFKEDVPTIADMLNSAGYETAIIGKWHLGLESPNTPNERGFDYFKGFLGDMMDDYWTHLREGNNYMRLNQQVIEPEGHATDLFSDWAIEYLENATQKKSPYFLFLAYNAPHFPIQPPDEWYEKVKNREPELSEKRAKNVAFVEHMDYSIGRVLAALEKSGLAKNTLIIYTSDNGGSLPHGASNGPLRAGKQDMYEGGIKVPTCFVWPGKINPGTQCDNLGLTMDLFATLCEISGVEIVHEIDGISLYPSILGKEQTTDDRTVYFMRREGGEYGGLCYYAARRGKYKLLQNTPYETLQMFDIAADPYETRPLDNNSKMFRKLKSSLSQHIRKSGAIPWQK